ncbi:MAG TPA: B12-binding domain-containing radical SAM protein, partial [Elusimicrobia bacterium]|nr:B12-binding domain-containing radical SAM protein [Elusimicrobiota bacterium]
MRVLLVQPPLNSNIIGAGLLYLQEPLALETLAASIPHHEVKILDMRIEPNLEEELNSFQPEIVGVTAYTPEVYIASDILQKVKNWNPEVLTVVGGQHATLLPGDFKKA